MDKVSLTASMRSNLLSLQNISRQVDATQNRLSTGKKVNSAIDNPSSYYTARSLSNRASDLDALLDSMGQAVSTIKAATTSLETAADFLEQAQAIANQTMEKAQSVIAHVSTEEELLAAINSGKEGLIVLDNDITMSANQNIELKDGQSLAGARYFDSNKPQTKLNFNFAGKIDNAIVVGNNTMISDLEINVTSDTCSNYTNAVLQGTAKVNLIYNNIDINMDFDAATGQGYYAMRGGDIEMRGNVNIVYTGSKANSLDMRGISRASVTMNDAVFNSSGFYYDVGNCTLTLNGNSRYNSSSGVYNLVYSDIYFNDSSSANLTAPQSCCGVGIYMQSAQTRLNISSSKPFFEGWYSYDAKIKAVDGAVISLSSGRFTAESDTDIKISGQVAELPSPQFSKDAAANVENDETYKSVMDDFAAYIQACRDNRTPNKVSDTQYSDILSQYDSLIKDSSYKGVNLLQNQDLKVTFNESRSAWLDVKGKDASSTALGLTTTEWNSKEDIEKSIEELTAAMNQIRTMSAELGSYYNIVLNRQDFTENLINVLEEGADKLTLADMNEESANMLALQTRQQLATNSLSLASQAAQSILRLF